MQKKLIAVAVAGALAAPLAFAQSNVTISGLVKAGYDQYKLRDTGAASSNTEHRISDQSSRIIFAGTEDLGGGLKAWFQLDARFNTDIGGNNAAGGNNWAGGNTGVGLMGNFGKLTLGRWDLHYSEFSAIEANRAGSLQSLLGLGFMSEVNGTQLAVGSRTSNVVMWDSPSWSGFTARVAYSTAFAGTEGSGLNAANTGDQGGGKAWNAALRYSNGPWTAGYSHWDGKQESRIPPTVDQKGDRAWVGFTFPMGLKVGLGYDRSKLTSSATGDTRRNAWLLPVSYSFGPHAVYATYARAGNVSGAGVAAGTDAKATAWMLGYDYAFSKRTSVGAFWTQINNKASAAYNMFAGAAVAGDTAPTAGQDPRQLYIGVAHSF